MKHVLFAAVALLISTTVLAAPNCLECRDQLKKAMESCKSEPAGENREMCRAGAQKRAEECEGDKAGVCNLDLLMDVPKKPEQEKTKS